SLPLCAGDKIVCCLGPPDSSSNRILLIHIGNDLVTRATTVTDEECVAETKQRLVSPGAREAHRPSAIGTDREPHWWWRIGLGHTNRKIFAQGDHGGATTSRVALCSAWYDDLRTFNHIACMAKISDVREL